jgi:DNA-directed RNA polymerase specialized sigma24 family protein
VEAVSSAAVALHLPRVESIARRFVNRSFGCEFDDLVQEGSEKLFKLLRDGKEPSNTAIKNAMRDWSRKCRRRGFATGELSSED